MPAVRCSIFCPLTLSFQLRVPNGSLSVTEVKFMENILLVLLLLVLLLLVLPLCVSMALYAHGYRRLRRADTLDAELVPKLSVW